MIGKTISHYKVLEKVGEGGMGVVYKAEDTRLKRTVALKFLSPDWTRDAEARERFVREAQAASALDHPNICTVHEIEETEGQTFIAMAYLDGQSLAGKITDGPLDVEEAVDIAVQIAEGLQEAHDKGVVHRDIKCANIMVSGRGRAKITDFGLARSTGQSRLTRAMTIMGTVDYMSPEQARGDTIDHRTDIWSLGVVLYEILTGKPPFTGHSDQAVIYSILNEPPERITDLRSDVPASLERIVQRMMQKDPDERYRNMAAVGADLKYIKGGTGAIMVSGEKRVPSIAVLPFADMSPQMDQEYFCDGLAEELINGLTQLQDLRVVARTSAFSFKKKDMDVRDIGRKLNVDTVLEGSVRKAGDRLRITAQLINISDGFHLWAERYDRELDDVFAIQDEITLTIVDKLKIKLLGQEETDIVKHPSVDLEAYNLFLKGRYFWNKMTEDALKKSAACFERAIELSPDYALAYTGLADCYSVFPYYSSFPPKEAYPKAREAALKALELDDSMAEAHASLGLIKTHYDWDWEGAEKEYARAIEINPGYAKAHHGYAMYLMFRGRLEEALKEAERARELDPLSLIINAFVGLIASFAGRCEMAGTALMKTIEMEPNFVYAHMFLGFAYLDCSMHEEAMEEFKKEKALSKGLNLSVEGYLGMACAVLGKRDRAQETLDFLRERSQKEYVPPFILALVSFGLGKIDEGFEWLDKAFEVRDHWLCWIKVNSAFNPVRSDPRYIALLKKIGLDD